MSTTGLQPGLGLPRGEGDRVALADADVEEAVGEVLADLLQLVPLAHGRGHHRDLRVVLHRLVQGEADRRRCTPSRRPS